jgi:hypothetical protein
MTRNRRYPATFLRLRAVRQERRLDHVGVAQDIVLAPKRSLAAKWLECVDSAQGGVPTAV